ncbi:MAG TPA: YfhO family protein [Vicinamibacterales bacterium]
MYAAIAVVVAIIPVIGVFTRTRLFFVRDLTMAFRPRFLFLRHAVASGTFPFWDPYTAHGQAAINDALYQLFHLPSLPIRLLLPEVPAYNIWIALPVPLAALGMYLFLRRQLRPLAAAFGAIAFALAGPIVSSTNFPNMSWSICAVPFVFWALELVFERRSFASAALLAVMVALQALAGEPVSLAATLAIVAGYTTLPPPRRRDWRLALLVAFGIVMGCLLAAVQYVPLGLATRGSARGQLVDTDFWTFHPLALIELLVPHFFGDYFNSNLRELSWMIALNSGRDPFYYTMYIGVPIALLAGVAMVSRRPATRFWTIVVLLCALASLGAHTPVYPLMQAIVPIVKSFRFPVKYLSLAAFGLATLSAMAFEWLLDGDVPRRPVRAVLLAAGALALVTYVVVAWVLIAPALPIRGFFRLAVWAKVPAPIQGAEFLLYRARPLLSSLLLKLVSVAFLLWVAASGRRERRLAIGVLAVFAVVDLLASNAGVNPTIDPKLLAEPEWLQHVPRDMHERVYIGGRPEGYVNTADDDAPKYARSMDEYSEMEQRYVVVSEYLFQPSAARIRESMSYDLPVLWPIEFARAHSLFVISSRAARLRFLERVGTRYALLPVPPFPGAKPLAEMVSTPQMHLYEIDPNARRVMVVPDALIGPSIDWQTQGMFLERFNPSNGVLVSEPPPPPSGVPGAQVPPSATFLEDGLNRVVVRAGLPQDGYLALFDTYNPDWKVLVDGAPAPLMRANGLFRAVHLARGVHVVTFTYRPHALYLGAALSAASALVLAIAWIAGRRGLPNPGAHG